MNFCFKTFIQDLEQDPFDAVAFVERVAWRIDREDGNLDSLHLMRKFEEEIASLQMLSEQFQGKLHILEKQGTVEQRNFCGDLGEMHSQNGEALERLKQLDSTMQSVFTKVVHLGDQLESVHAPRARAFEALQLMRHFEDFMTDQYLQSQIFSDPDRLLEAAEMIQKLSSISQEIAGEKYTNVQRKIARQYEKIESMLIEEFEKSHDRKKLREIAMTLSDFKNYNQCLDSFIRRVQMGGYRSGNVFQDIMSLCEKNQPLIEEIFPKPHQVMSKLVLNVFQGQLKDTVKLKLEQCETENEIYLPALYDFYTKTVNLQRQLQKFNFETDSNFLQRLTKSIFAKYLEDYASREQELIRDQCKLILNRFYESKGHQKRNLPSGGLHELKRDLQAWLLTVEHFGDETFLSEEVAISVLQETKNAFTRCSMLCEKKEDAAMMASILFDLLVNYLYTEHIDYAIELAILGISSVDPKSEPPTVFLRVVQQTAAITHLFVKQFDDSVYPLIKDNAAEDKVISKSDVALQHVESRIRTGLERQLNAIVTYVRYMLNTEQKRSDFFDEKSDGMPREMSMACRKVSLYILTTGEKIRECIDGTNLIEVLTELGTRLYTTILNHVRSFTFNETGGLLLIADVKEYHRAIETWQIPAVSKKFDILPSLANLLVVKQENLQQSMAAQMLADTDRDLVAAFIQLRSDAKVNKRMFS